MPRKRSRYGRLLRELKTTGGSPTAGTELDNFLKYLTGQNTLQILNKPDADDLKRYNVAIHPFAVEGDDATSAGRMKVGITAYSYTGINASGLSNNDCGIFFIEGGEEEDSNFYPALAWFKKSQFKVTKHQKSSHLFDDYKGKTRSLN